MVSNLPLLVGISLLNATVYQQQEYLLQVKRNMTCQYYDEPLYSDQCNGNPGDIGHRIIDRVPLPNQTLFCPVQQELESCFVPLEPKPQLLSLTSVTFPTFLPEPVNGNAACDLSIQSRFDFKCRYKSTGNQPGTKLRNQNNQDCTNDLLEDLTQVSSHDETCYTFSKAKNPKTRARSLVYYKNGKICNFFTLFNCKNDCVYADADIEKDGSFYSFIFNECSMDDDLVETANTLEPNESEDFCPLTKKVKTICKPKHWLTRFIILLVSTIVLFRFSYMIIDTKSPQNMSRNSNDNDEKIIKEQLEDDPEGELTTLDHNVTAIFTVLYRYSFSNTNQDQEPPENEKKSKGCRYYCCCGLNCMKNGYVWLFRYHGLITMLLIIIGWVILYYYITSVTAYAFIAFCINACLIFIWSIIYIYFHFFTMLITQNPPSTRGTGVNPNNKTPYFKLEHDCYCCCGRKDEIAEERKRVAISSRREKCRDIGQSTRNFICCKSNEEKPAPQRAAQRAAQRAEQRAEQHTEREEEPAPPAETVEQRAARFLTRRRRQNK